MHLYLERILGHELPTNRLYQLFDQFWQVVCGDGSHTEPVAGRLSPYVKYLLTYGKYGCYHVPKRTQKGGLMHMARGGTRCVAYGDSKAMARTLRKAAGFFFWALAICAAIALVALIVTLLLSEARFEGAGLDSLLGREALDLKKRVIDAIQAGTASPGAVRALVSAGAFGMCVVCAVWAIVLNQLRGILKSVEDGRPFEPANARRVAIMGWTFVVGSPLFACLDALGVRVALRVVDISGVHFRFTLNASTLSAGLVLLVLAAVFRHGSYLQGEYDATL